MFDVHADLGEATFAVNIDINSGETDYQIKGKPAALDEVRNFFDDLATLSRVQPLVVEKNYILDEVVDVFDRISRLSALREDILALGS